MTLAYAAKLGLTIWKTNINGQKIDSLSLKTYRMVITGFLVQDRLEKVWFFKKTFLLIDTSMKVILEILFFIFSNVDIWFIKKELIWRSYTTTEALPTIKKVKLIDKKKFATAGIDKNSEIFIIHMIALDIL